MDSKASKLLLHVKAFQVSREDLIAVETPERTSTWTPVSHYDMVMAVLNRADEAGFTVRREMYGLTPGGVQMFGVIDLTHQVYDEMGFSIGLRNSHNKTLRAGICAGSRVFVCDNLVFSGEMTSLSRKHSAHFTIAQLIEKAFEALPFTLEQLCADLSALKQQECTEADAKLTIFKAAQQHIIAPSEMLDIYQEYINPTYEEFRGMNRYNLVMAFTEKAKNYSTAKALKSYQGIGKLFDL